MLEEPSLKPTFLRVRRVVTFLLLLVILGFRVNVSLLRLPFSDRSDLAKIMWSFPDRRWPQFPRFLDGVRSRTRSGDSIALLFPTMQWNGGYADAYYRASYFLAGREVLPLVTTDERAHPENLRSAGYVAAWQVNVRPRGATVVWRGEGGELLKRE